MASALSDIGSPYNVILPIRAEAWNLSALPSASKSTGVRAKVGYFAIYFEFYYVILKTAGLHRWAGNMLDYIMSRLPSRVGATNIPSSMKTSFVLPPLRE